jgi:hypothetical protein
MPRFWLLLSAALVSSGCGYIGEPLPPALCIPQPVADLSAMERGSKILVQFTLPTHTTENLEIRKPVTAELAIGLSVNPFQFESWEASAKRIPDIPADHPNVKYGVPCAEWIGKDVVIGVKVYGSNGRAAGWSKLVTLSIVPPLAPPASLASTPVSEGVLLTWRGSAPHYRIYRRAGNQLDAAAIAETDDLKYTDTKTEYGATYRYYVEGFRGGGDVRAVSEPAAEVEITPKDTWPPPVPAGLAFVTSAGSIELVWERSIAPDLAGYRIYRAEGAGAFQRIAETRQGPSYSDRKIEPGKTYRYAVSAFDQLDNESDKSTAITVTVP